ncbi:MAG: Zn-ribbon domain-containing OB-fold protein, partial [Dehalococcoidales bacterium]|nr:Zn-ribbon domain-containing OB-fold protein [Dehalococcoidales bacterium]
MTTEKKVELITVPDKWEIPYEYSAGETVSRFLVELRDNARIMATKCPKCQQVLLPPRSFCASCFVSLKDQWVELKPVGELVTYSICTADIPGVPKKPPYIVAFVTMDGSDTTMAQYLEGLDLSDPDKVAKELKAGMPIKAVFK